LPALDGSGGRSFVDGQRPAEEALAVFIAIVLDDAPFLTVPETDLDADELVPAGTRFTLTLHGQNISDTERRGSPVIAST
jgi:hypothetical protein